MASTAMTHTHNTATRTLLQLKVPIHSPRGHQEESKRDTLVVHTRDMDHHNTDEVDTVEETVTQWEQHRQTAQ
jgi:hypothetical protein